MDSNTLTYAYKKPAYKELPVKRNLFLFTNLKQGTSSLYVYKDFTL